MRSDPQRGDSWNYRRGFILAAIVAVGLVAVVGSGGGGALGFPDLSCLDTPAGCGVTGPAPPEVPVVTISPGRLTVQLGTAVVFTATSNDKSPIYGWCRQPKGSSVCAEISGANGASYTLAGANLSDDGAVFGVTATGTLGTATAGSRLAVSSLPGVVFQDSEFLDSDWVTNAMLDPSVNGPTYSVSRATTGGNPGAFRSLAYELKQAPSAVRVFNVALSATYDPAVQGEIKAIDFSEDCTNIATAEGLANTLPMLEQGGRQYTAAKAYTITCYSPGWYGFGLSSLSAAEFVIANGPACGAGESCPDFSTRGAAIRFGFSSAAALKSPLAPGASAHVAHGIDNWKVTLWRP